MKCSDIRVFYVGSDEENYVKEKLEPLFGKIGNRTPVRLSEKYAYSPATEYKEGEEKFNLTQGRLVLGLTCDSTIGDFDSSVMSMYNDILGGSSTSKLFMNVREKKSLCYYCGSANDNCCGTIMIHCGIKPENYQLALDEIKNQIEQMRLGNISDEEISVSKKGIINSLNQITDASVSIVTSSFKYKLLTGDVLSVEKRKNEILSITREDIVRFAQKVKINTVFFLNESGEGCEEDAYDE